MIQPDEIAEIEQRGGVNGLTERMRFYFRRASCGINSAWTKRESFEDVSEECTHLKDDTDSAMALRARIAQLRQEVGSGERCEVGAKMEAAT